MTITSVRGTRTPWLRITSFLPPPYIDARTQRLILTLAAPVKQAPRLMGVSAVDLFIDMLVQRVTACASVKTAAPT